MINSCVSGEKDDSVTDNKLDSLFTAFPLVNLCEDVTVIYILYSFVW